MLKSILDKTVKASQKPAKILSVAGLKKYFVSGLFHRKIIKAVNGLSLEIHAGESLALMGESGYAISCLSL